jgi:ubiquinone biosynthesis protein
VPPAPATDLELGSFTDHGPWVVDPAAMPWRKGIDDVRARVRGELPALTRPRKVPPGDRVLTTARHIGGALGLWAAGGRRRQGGAGSVGDLSRRLRIAAEHLGPTYIKLGQIISSGEGIFPDELVTEFKRCRDQVPPEPWPVVRRVVEEELGCRLELVFSRFDETPLAAASIAQVHVAQLIDGFGVGAPAGQLGPEVVVKVQRPTVEQRVHRDLQVMAWLAPFLVGRIPVSALANPPALVELFAETITEELDFRLEAENMLDVARTFAELGQRGYVIPRPHPTLVTRRMLVMERLSGFKFEDVAGMQAAGVDTYGVVRTGLVGFMEGALIHGIFHGDLHGGNLFVQPDGRTALLDFGITGRLSEPKRRAFLGLLASASMNDLGGQLAALRDLGALPTDTDLAAVIAELGLDRPPIDPTQLSSEELLGEVQRTVKALLGYGARMPKELMLFVKNMVFLDGAIATLAPDLDIFAEIATVSMHFATKHGERLAAELGMAPDAWELDMTGFKAAVGLDEDAAGLTYRELQERRAQIRDRFAAHQRPRGRRRKR